MNNIEQVRESISDASYALTQAGEDAPHLTQLVMQNRLSRLVDLEYALLTGYKDKHSGVASGVKVNIESGDAESSHVFRVVEDTIKSAVFERDSEKGPRYLTITKEDGSKHTYRFAE